MATSTPVLEWRKEVKGIEYLISTSIDLLDLEMINNAFESEEMYWAKRLDIDTLKLMLQHSTTLGVYEVPPAIPEPATVSEPSTPRTPSPSTDGPSQPRPKQIASRASSQTTGLDLGKWLVACCKEVIDFMPALRRAFLVATPGKGMEFYGRELGFWDAGEERGKIAVMTRRGFAL
nr:hypothetical protein B0A51_11443 [Rachicladosporium sp. CCFEE 5018]